MTPRAVYEWVRRQLDVDEEDLPDELLYEYVREGFERTFAFEERWPFFKYTWEFTVADTTFTLPNDPPVAHIETLRDADRNIRLAQIEPTEAEERFEGSIVQATPTMFSVWGDTVTLWPESTGDPLNLVLRGFRQAVWNEDPDVEMDGDPRLHTPIKHYAASLAYAQLEDTELEDKYMLRWGQTAQQAAELIMSPQYHAPLVMSQTLRQPRGDRPRFVLQIP